MPKLRIYLDTSVINYLFADHSPEKRDATRIFFDNVVRTRRAEVFVSAVVPAEINRTKDENRKQLLLAALEEYGLSDLSEDALVNQQEAEDLADRYLEAGTLPEREFDDALHVAMATLMKADMLLSWNFKHLANVNREMRFNAVNLSAGYTHTLRICTPWEVLDVTA